MRQVREKHHRLPDECYRGELVVAFTANLKLHPQAPVTEDLFRPLAGFLEGECRRYGCSAEAYVLMPDHGHFLLRGDREDSDVLKAMRSFKHLSGYWFYKNDPQYRWQKDFYDHIVRTDEEKLIQIRYILENPVKKGLVQSWKDYPFKGSMVHDLAAWDECL